MNITEGQKTVLAVFLLFIELILIGAIVAAVTGFIPGWLAAGIVSVLLVATGVAWVRAGNESADEQPTRTERIKELYVEGEIDENEMEELLEQERI